MNKKIMQFRYYGNKNKNNFPTNIKSNDITSESFFKEYYPIHYIKIQGPEGIKIYINSNSNNIMIGPSEIYELDLQGFSTIENLKFENISSSTPKPIIIDLIYG